MTKPNDTLALYRLHRARVNTRKQAELAKAVLAVKLAEVAPPAPPELTPPLDPAEKTGAAGGKKGPDKPQ
jgi:hypothetical protein